MGLLTLDLHMGEATSLKGKRRVLKSLLDKIKARYNVSVAEVGKQDSWQFSTVGVSFVSNEPAHVHQTLAAVIRFVEGTGDVEIIHVQTELL